MPSTTPARSIPSYNLFGESADLPDVIHCETIAARSMLHDWELAPHRHARLHQVLFLGSGGGRAQLDEHLVDLHPGQVVNVPTGRVHAFHFTPGTQGWVVTLASDTLDQVLVQAGDVRRRLARALVAPAPAALPALMQQLADEFDGRSYARAQVLRGLAAALLGLVSRALESVVADPAAAASGRAPSRLSAQLPVEGSAGHGPSPAPGGRPAAKASLAPLLSRFEALLESHHPQRWGVADYARALSVSSTHLSRVVRQACGVPASQLIEDRLIREARRNLQYTSLQAASIAYMLGFADPAHFSRVFKRATGLSPGAYRKAFASRASS